jgi:hypothetical protein
VPPEAAKIEAGHLSLTGKEANCQLAEAVNNLAITYKNFSWWVTRIRPGGRIRITGIQRFEPLKSACPLSTDYWFVAAIQ